MFNNDISVIIPTFNDYQLTNQCLKTLFASIEDIASPEVIVVDDGSDKNIDELRQVVNSYSGRVQLIAKEENKGFSHSVNTGIKAATREDILLLNNDIEFINKDWLKNLHEAAYSDPSLGIIGAKLLYPSSLIQHAGVYVSSLQLTPEHRYHFAPHNLKAANKFCLCLVTGALQYVKRSTIDKIGLYDESYELAFEDMEFCMQAAKNDIQIMYAPNVVAVHREGMTRGGTYNQVTSRKSQNRVNRGFKRFMSRWAKDPVYRQYFFYNLKIAD